MRTLARARASQHAIALSVARLMTPLITIADDPTKAPSTCRHTTIADPPIPGRATPPST